MMSQNYKSKNFSQPNQKLSEITQLQTLESVSRSAIVKHLLKKLNSLKAATKFFELYCSKLQKFGIFFVPKLEKTQSQKLVVLWSKFLVMIFKLYDENLGMKTVLFRKGPQT